MTTKAQHKPGTIPRMLAIVAALGLAVSACGDTAGDESGAGVAVAGSSGSGSSTDGDGGDDGDDGGSGGGLEEEQDAGDGDGTTSSTGQDDTEHSGSEGEPDDEKDLPGEYFDIGPVEGERLDVVGVRFDDTLNFRTRPDISAPVVETIAVNQTTPAIISAGHGRLLTRSAWWKVTLDGEEAWANTTFLGMLGAADDITVDLLDSLPTATAPTIEELVDVIAEDRASGPEPRVEFVTPNDSSGTTGAAVTVDVLGIGDDALAGERFTLDFNVTRADPGDEDSDIVSVELAKAIRTLICGRGVSDGSCL